MTTDARSLHIRLEEGGEEFNLISLKDGVSYYSRDDFLLCRCDRPLIVEGAYTPSGRDEGSILCAVADRYVPGSLLGQGRLPAMVDVFTVRPHVTSEIGALTDEDVIFAYTGLLRDA